VCVYTVRAIARGRQSSSLSKAAAFAAASASTTAERRAGCSSSSSSSSSKTALNSGQLTNPSLSASTSCAEGEGGTQGERTALREEERGGHQEDFFRLCICEAARLRHALQRYAEL
jgi:hypothetical protein